MLLWPGPNLFVLLDLNPLPGMAGIAVSRRPRKPAGIACECSASHSHASSSAIDQHRAVRQHPLVSLPTSRLSSPRRPCDAMKMTSHPCLVTASMIPWYGIEIVISVWHVTPAALASATTSASLALATSAARPSNALRLGCPASPDDRRDCGQPHQAFLTQLSAKLNSVLSSSPLRLPIHCSPVPTAKSASSRLARIMSLIRSSNVARVMNRWT